MALNTLDSIRSLIFKQKKKKRKKSNGKFIEIEVPFPRVIMLIETNQLTP